MNWMIAPQHITLDIETTAGDPCEAEAALRREFAPDPRWKPATIGERYLQALEVKKERLALLDTAPIISVALRTEVDCRLLHWLNLQETAIAGVPLERLPDERAMLIRLRDYLQLASPETILVGHNIRHFDLPRLRLAMIRYGLRLPPCLAWPDQPTYDTMIMWRFFSVNEKLVSLEECLQLAGLESHKTTVCGEDIPALYQRGEYRTIAAYAIADVLAQDALYLAMTGQVPTDRVGPTDPVGPEATGGHAVIEEAAAREVAAGPSGTIPPAAEAATDVETILHEFAPNLYYEIKGTKP